MSEPRDKVTRPAEVGATRPKVGTTPEPGATRPEVLAPAGDRDALAAALAAGADAVYFGLDDGFNARARAVNFPSTGLADVIAWVHRAGARVYITVNTLVFEPELPIVEELLRRIAAAGADAIIVQDPAVALLARAICSDLEIHASTQMTASSPLAVELLAELGLARVVVPRELSVDEIRAFAAASSVPLEVFIHGALCVAWSGQCLSSEAWGGRSANRGQCAQACRLPYQLVIDGDTRDLGDVAYLLSPKDLVGLDAVEALADIGVAGLKIEGRLKGPAYVATAVAQYRDAVDAATSRSTSSTPSRASSTPSSTATSIPSSTATSTPSSTSSPGGSRTAAGHRAIDMGRSEVGTNEVSHVVRTGSERTHRVARRDDHRVARRDDDRVARRDDDRVQGSDSEHAEAATIVRNGFELPRDEASLHVAYSRGGSRGFLLGTDHQTLVEGRFPRHRGLPLGRVVTVSGDSVIVVRDPAQRPNTGGRGMDGRDLDGRDPDGRDSVGRDPDGRGMDGRDSDGHDSDSRDPDGRDLDGRDSDGRDSHGRDPEILPRAGMGVVFDRGRPEETEQGGPIFAVELIDVRGDDVRGSDVRGDDVRCDDVRGDDVRGDDVRGGDVRGDRRGGDVRAGDVRAGDVRAGDVRGGDVRGGDVRAGDVRAGDVRGDGRGSDIRGGDGRAGDGRGDGRRDVRGGSARYERVAKRFRLRFGRPGPDLSRVSVGDFVWVSSDPRVTRAGERAAEIGREPLQRIAVDLQVRGEAGTPLDVTALAHSRGRDFVARASSKSVLAPARGSGLSPALLHDKLGGFGGTPFHLATLDATALAAGLHLPVSELKELRRELVAALDAKIVESGRDVATSSKIEAVRAALVERRANADAHRVDVDSTTSQPLLVPLCRNDVQLDAVLDAGAREVELDWMELVGLGRAVERARRRGARVGVATVRVQKPGEERIDAHLARLEPDFVLVRSWGSLAYFASLAKLATPPALHGDFSLNVTNSITAAWVLARGLATITAAHDLDRDQLLAMLDAAPRGRVGVAIHHHLPTFHTEHCVYAHLLSKGRDYRTCGRPCERHAVSLRDRVGLVHPVIVDVGCRNTVFNAQAQSAASLVPTLRARGVTRFRLELVRESAAETRELYDAYRRLVAGELAPAEAVRRAAAHEQFGVTRGTMRTLTVLG